MFGVCVPVVGRCMAHGSTIGPRAHWMVGHSPCLTSARFRGHWVSSRNRYMAECERLRLFGFPISFCRRGVSEEKFGMLLGNSTVVDVIAPVLQRLLLASGLVRKASALQPVLLAHDFWACGLSRR